MNDQKQKMLAVMVNTSLILLAAGIWINFGFGSACIFAGAVFLLFAWVLI